MQLNEASHIPTMSRLTKHPQWKDGAGLSWRITNLSQNRTNKSSHSENCEQKKHDIRKYTVVKVITSDCLLSHISQRSFCLLAELTLLYLTNTTYRTEECIHWQTRAFGDRNGNEPDCLCAACYTASCLHLGNQSFLSVERCCLLVRTSTTTMTTPIGTTGDRK